MFTTIIIFTAVLSLLVFVHELGHFMSARSAGVHVEEFGFGFPPRAVGFKRGKTLYSLNWIPLGGFVKIKGESGDRRHDKDSFGAKSKLTRTFILAAGVVMNFVLAWVLLSVGYAIGLPQVAEDLPASARVRDPKVQVMSILKDSPAERAGMESGDALLTYDGIAVTDTDAFRSYTATRKDAPIALTVNRRGEHKDLSVVPADIRESGRVGIGVALVRTGFVSYPWYLVPLQAALTTYEFGREVVLAFLGLIRDLVVTREVTVEFSGPVGIAVLTAEVARMGFSYLLQFTALLSVNLGVINILPFPALDGGRVAFLVAEAVRRRPVSRRLEVAAHNIGFALLMILVLVITYRDVLRFGGKFVQSLGRLFGG